MRCNPKMLNHTRLATVAAVGDGSVGRDGVPCPVPMHPRPGHHQSRQQPQFNKERDVPQARKVTPQCEAAHKGRPYRLLNSLRVPEFRWRMSDQDLLWPSSSPARLRVLWPQRSKTITMCTCPNRCLGRDPGASKRFEVRRDGRSEGRSELIRTARPLCFARSGLGGSTTSMDVFYAGRAGRKGGLV
jgi:hypothetical protein